jgi:amino acid transporter
MSSANSARPELLRAIGRWDLTAAVVNGVIGSSIFGLPGTLAKLVGVWSPLACLAAGLGTLLVVLCFAEVASRFREAGGPYLYAREAFGPLVGFEAGWLTFWIRVTAVAANLNVFVQYLSEIAPQARSPVGRAVVITGLVLLVALINLRGVRQATWTINVFTLAKLLPLLLLIVLGLPALSRATLLTQTVSSPDWIQAVLLLVFAYGGFEAPLIPASEAKDPRRDSGFALLLALGLVAALYMLVQLTVVGLVPEVRTQAAPLAAAFGLLLGPAGVTLAALTAMVSVYGYATGNALQSPRVIFAMAQRGELPAVLARVHAGFRTPYAAIALYALVVWGLALYGSFEWNATLSAVVRLVTYALTCAALVVFRRRRGLEPAGFQAPAGLAVAVAGLAFCLGLLASRSFAQAGVLLALAGVGPLLWLWSRRGATH